MIRFFTFCLILLMSLRFCNAQTRVTVLGTLHSPTKYVNVDTLVKALSDLKPDLILMELDTSLMDKDGVFKFNIKNSLEGQAAAAYKNRFPATKLRAIDVANRNQFYKTHSTFAREEQFGKYLDSLYRTGALADTSRAIVSALYAATQALNNLSEMKLADFNSQESMNLVSFRQYLLYDREMDVVNSSAQLSKWGPLVKEDADFWDLRTTTMVNNIVKYAKNFRGKNIVFMVGFYHKYAIVNGLNKIAKANNFILVDNYK